VWSSGHVPGYRSRRPGFASRRYQIFWVVGLERGPLSLVSTNEELLGRKSSGCGLDSREYGRRDPLRWPRDILYPQKLALNKQRSLGRQTRYNQKPMSIIGVWFCCFLVWLTLLPWRWRLKLLPKRPSLNFTSLSSESHTLPVETAAFFHWPTLLPWGKILEVPPKRRTFS
jgi:hypothetical protein